MTVSERVEFGPTGSSRSLGLEKVGQRLPDTHASGLPSSVSAEKDGTSMGRRAAMRNAVAAASTLGVGVATAANAEIQDQMRESEKAKGYYTKKDYCEQSDRESRNGVEFGCEAFVKDPEKRTKMRRRALTALKDMSAKIEKYDANTVSAATAANIRRSLRQPPFDGLRVQARRFAILSEEAGPQAEKLSEEMIAKITSLDLKARRLEIDSSPDLLLDVTIELKNAQAVLRALLALATEDDLKAIEPKVSE